MKTSLQDCFSEDRQSIVYRETTAPWIGFIILFFSFVFLLVTASFFAKIWNWPWHGGKVAGLLSLLLFAALGISAGLLGYGCIRPQNLKFDAETRRVHGRVRDRLGLLRPIDTTFNSLHHPVIKSIDREMDSDVYEIRVQWTGHLPLALGRYEKRSDAEYWRARLDRLFKI